MHPTRRTMLDHLKRHPGATLPELARSAGVAPITARAHVAVMSEDGLLRAIDVRARRGRPFRRYFLTEAAESYFPRHYDSLAASLLNGIVEIESPETVDALVRHVATGMAQTHLPRVQGKTLAKRVAAIAEVIDQQGGAADWEATDDGFVVHERNCPYFSVSRCTEHVCEIDRQMVSILAGSPVEVKQRLRDGAESCDFMIKEPSLPEPSLPEPSLPEPSLPEPSLPNEPSP